MKGIVTLNIPLAQLLGVVKTTAEQNGVLNPESFSIQIAKKLGYKLPSNSKNSHLPRVSTKNIPLEERLNGLTVVVFQDSKGVITGIDELNDEELIVNRKRMGPVKYDYHLKNRNGCLHLLKHANQLISWQEMGKLMDDPRCYGTIASNVCNVLGSLHCCRRLGQGLSTAFMISAKCVIFIKNE